MSGKVLRRRWRSVNDGALELLLLLLQLSSCRPLSWWGRRRRRPVRPVPVPIAVPVVPVHAAVSVTLCEEPVDDSALQALLALGPCPCRLVGDRRWRWRRRRWPRRPPVYGRCSPGDDALTPSAATSSSSTSVSSSSVVAAAAAVAGVECGGGAAAVVG